MTPNHSRPLVTWGLRSAGLLPIIIGGFWLAASLGGWVAPWAADRPIAVPASKALGLLLGGIALVLFAGGNPSRVRASAVTGLAAVVFLVGALTLSEHIFGFDLEIDQRLAHESWRQVAGAYFDHSALPDSLSLILIGAGLFLLTRGGREVVPYLGLAVCLINLVPAGGFLYGIEFVLNEPEWLRVSWPGVASLLALGLGLVLAEPPAEAKRRQLEALHEQHQRTAAILGRISDAFFGVDREWRFAYVNAEAERLLRRTSVELLGKRVWDLFPGAENFRSRYEKALASGQAEHFEEYYPPLASWFECHAYPSADGLSVFFRDATARRRHETNQAMLTDVLRVLNRGGNVDSLVKEALDLIQQAAGFDAVGVRLRKGEDFPYYQQTGFSEEFLKEDNSLIAKDESGAVLRDAQGCPRFRCACGVVVSGRQDPALPCIASDGSFWTNKVSEASGMPSDPAVPATSPNMCIKAGYQSIGLFPIRFREELVGVLQLTDRREGQFDAESVVFYRTLAQNLGLALQRAQVEVALRESESFYRQTLESIPGMVFTTRPEGYCDYQSQQWVEYTGVPMSEHLGDGWTKLLHPDDRPRAFEAWRAAVEGRAPYDLEYRVRRRDGLHEWFKVKGQPIRDTAGKVVRWFGVAMRIEDLKAAEQAVRESEARLAFALEVSQTGHWELDLASHSVRRSLRHDRVFGYDKLLPSWTYEMFLEHVLPEDRERVDQAFRDAVEQGRDWDFECRIRRADGQTRWIWAAGRHVPPAAGSARSMAGIVQDVTQHKLAAQFIDAGKMLHGKLIKRSGRWETIESSEHVHAEMALRESEERLRLAMWAADLGVIQWDPATDCAVWENPRMFEIFGRDQAEGPLSKAQLLQVMHPDDTAAFEAALAEATEPGHLFHSLFRIRRHKDGQWRWLENAGRFERTPGGEASRLTCVVRDVTDWKQREEELRKLNRTLRALSNSNQALMRAQDEPSYLQDACHIIVRDCGYDAVWIGYAERDEHKTVRPVAQAGFEAGSLESLRVTWSERDDGGCPSGAAIRTGQPQRCFCQGTAPEFVRGQADAAARGCASCIAFPLLAEGHPFGSITIYSKEPDSFSDDEWRLLGELADDLAYGINALRLREAHARAEQALRQSRADLNHAQAVGRIGSWRFDLSRGEMRWSDEACRILGIAPGTPLDEAAFLQFVHPEDRDQVSERWQTARRGEAYDFEHRVVAGGEIKWVRQRAELEFDPQGQLRGGIGTLQDVTERKEMELALRHQELLLRERATHLEELVRQRTAELQNIVAELEHYSYTITHDLRAPLRAMRGFSELLLASCDTRSSPDQLDLLRRIGTSAQRMDQLIRDALDYSRAVRNELPLSEVPLEGLLRGLVESYPQFQAPKAYIEIEPSLPSVLGNEAALTQCFSNLLGNAVKFVAPNTVPRIRVYSERQDGYVRIWVDDNGVGIPQDCHERIFEMFQQLSRNYGGTGIGLALVRKVVHRMGGRVGVQSNPGEGSRFWVDLKRPG